MPLFQCQTCGSVDNTALTHRFWGAEKKECTECQTGTWHGKFPKLNAYLEGYFTDGRYIYRSTDVDLEKMAWTGNKNFKIIGKCPEIVLNNCYKATL